jgi:hypothetical protein
VTQSIDSTTEAFRARYRSAIHASYSGHLHALWIATAGLSVVAISVAQLESVATLEWLVLVLALVLGNVGEYAIHIHLGHRKKRWATLFYQRHTGDHHSFFNDTNMQWQTPRDWRVVLFPAWLILLVVVFIGAPGAWAFNHMVSSNAAWLWLAGITTTYLLYEAFHFSDHLANGHWLHRFVPGLAAMAHLHRLHHHRDNMTAVNFNLTFPLTDYVMKTLSWQAR